MIIPILLAAVCGFCVSRKYNGLAVFFGLCLLLLMYANLMGMLLALFFGGRGVQ